MHLTIEYEGTRVLNILRSVFLLIAICMFRADGIPYDLWLSLMTFGLSLILGINYDHRDHNCYTMLHNVTILHIKWTLYSGIK